jgi:hypothetical protein
MHASALGAEVPTSISALALLLIAFVLFVVGAGVKLRWKSNKTELSVRVASVNIDSNNDADDDDDDDDAALPSVMNSTASVPSESLLSDAGRTSRAVRVLVPSLLLVSIALMMISNSTISQVCVCVETVVC